MSVFLDHSAAPPLRQQRYLHLLALALPIVLAACGEEPKEPAPEIRPVRTVTVEKRQAGVPVVLTGRIEAEDEVRLAFRLSGRHDRAQCRARATGSRPAS